MTEKNKKNSTTAGKTASKTSTAAHSTTSKNSKKSNIGVMSVIGGIAAAAAVGGYFLYQNKDAQKKIKAVKGWALKAKGDVLEKVEKLKEVNQDLYHKTVDAVLAKYEKMPHVDKAELVKMSKEIKSHWKSIHSDVSLGSKKAVAVVKAAVKAGKKVAAQPVLKNTSTQPAKKSAEGMKKA